MTNPRLEIEIFHVTEVSNELFEACQRLIPQLTRNNPPPTYEMLAQMLKSPCSFLFLAKHPDFGEQIIGMATLVLYQVPTGLRGYIEDIVVDEQARGRHIGEALTRACLNQAQEAGVPQVMLTSNPGRTAANGLYQHMGFEQRKTNVYRFSFKEDRKS